VKGPAFMPAPGLFEEVFEPASDIGMCVASQDDVTSIAAVHLCDLTFRLLDRIVEGRLDIGQILLESGDSSPEIEDSPDTFEIQALVGEFLDESEFVDVVLRVASGTAGCSVRLDESTALVDTQRLRMHTRKLCGD